MIFTCQAFISKPGSWPFLKVKDLALEITTGNSHLAPVLT